MFNVGQKVICIKRGLWRLRHNSKAIVGGPQYGDILQIKSIEINESKHETSLTFTEYPGRYFNSYRFRPLQEKGMSILRSILENTPEEENA